MSGLSKNVMNMKFMQKSANAGNLDTLAEKSTRVKDNSEWELPSKVQIQKSLKPVTKVSSMGYGSIALLTQQSGKKEKSSGDGDEDDEAAGAVLSASSASKVCSSCLSYLNDTNLQSEKGNEAKKFLQDILGDSKKRSKRAKKPPSKNEKDLMPNKRFKAQ